MATKYFQSILDAAKKLGLHNVKSWAARKWFQKQATDLKNATPQKLMNQADKLSSTKPGPGSYGKMLCFFYDPKWKHKLPYYDRFPVIFVVDKAPGGFYGLNLHYLPPLLRSKLFDALYQNLLTGQDEKRKLRIDYQILKSTSGLSAFRPCFKHYLYTHVRSKYLVVPPQEWDTILFLPVARFERGGGKLDGVPGKVGGPISEQRIWQDSRRKIGGRS